MSLMTALCCLMIVLSANVFGQEITISTAQEFYGNVTVDNRTKTFKQTADLDFSSLTEAQRAELLGRFVLKDGATNNNSSNAFAGTYDGDGHKITGLTVTLNIDNTPNADLGLFGCVLGTVKNLTIENANVTSTRKYGENENWSVFGSVGIIAGKVGGTYKGRNDQQIAYTAGTIENCQVLNSTLNVTQNRAAGMIAGAVEGRGKITRCVASGSITAKHIAGGIVGKMFSNKQSGNSSNLSQSVEYCSFTGSVTANPSVVGNTTYPAYAGGICGSIGNGKGANNEEPNASGAASNATFTGCYTNAEVTATGDNGYAAGIVNSTNTNNRNGGAKVDNSYAAGTTTAEKTTRVSQSNNASSTTTNKTNNDISTDALNNGLADADKFQEVNGEILPGNLCSTATEWETAKEGNYTDASTWKDGKFPANATTNITIKHQVTIPTGKTVTFKNGMTIGFAAGGKLIVADGGNLINKTGTALTATMQKNVTKEKWNFIGLPIAAGEQGIGISPLANVEGDIWALQYKQGEWDENYLHWNETNKSYIKEGEGIFAWPDADYTLNIDGTLVNGDVTRIAVESKWYVQNFVALANPYPAAIKIADLVALNGVQGQVCYIYNGTSYDTPNTGTIPVGTGFFLNTGENITFTPSMIDGYATTTAKSTPAERDFLTVSVSTNGYKVPVMFAKNEAATAEYDIFDANKMFGDGTVAEPYLICNGIDLCKEEVNALPYTATMNIKSGEAQSVEIIAENIPEGYSLILLDGEEEIVMNQGDVYTVNIASGENADRFKLKIGEKNVSITDVEVAEALSIRNNNRNIIIEGGKNIKAEVYNTLGQKVYETTKRNFSLEGVEAGAYVVKVQSGNAVQSHKMIIE